VCYRLSSYVNERSKSSSDLTTAQLGKLRKIFDAATEQDPQNRGAFLDTACEGDKALRREVEGLLAAHGSESSWLDQPLLFSEPGSWEGRAVGPYRLVRQLGSGGMATVYLAERSIGNVRQQVALKVIRPSFVADTQMMRRFEHEREILASLDHPNIARLRDIGSTEQDIPYLVMDYVDGDRIDQYCERHKLGIPEKLALFSRTCEAIQYAHSKGVIHRDLKPSNILITSDGSVKLLDFGIAKVLRQADQTGTLLTQSGASLMTIEYASPEQIRGENIGPQSDVYSLGVLLYELLTGNRPYRTEGLMMHAIAQAICEEQPAIPSSVAPQLAGDLDHIVLKALRKEPQWRYKSPADFAEDIRRHLAGARVLARADTFHYRLERIVRRILHPAEGVFHTQGMMMFTAGLLGIGLLMERQEILSGHKVEANTGLDAALIAVWLCWSMWEGRRMIRAGRFSALDRQSWIVFSVITTVLGVLSIVSELRPVVTPEPMAIFWNAGLAIGFLIVGFQATRVLTGGGIALFASAVAASFYPRHEYLCLAAGMLGGMVIPGLILAVQRVNPSAGVSLEVRRGDRTK
jgi:tRNA A-37 threonylcarbamoyl transferase component Bud32